MTKVLDALDPECKNFYSHAREGRDRVTLKNVEDALVISTHTPARGVTDMYNDYLQGWEKFLLTRPRGA